MANRVYLNCIMSCLGNNKEDHEIGEACNKFPLLWAALFELQDLVIDDEDQFYLRADTHKALALFRSRKKSIKTYFPEPIWEYFEKWETIINSIKHPFLEVQIDEYAALFDSDEQFIEDLSIIFSFGESSINFFIKEEVFAESFLSGLSGYIHPEFNWYEEDDYKFIKYKDKLIEISPIRVETKIKKLQVINNEIVFISTRLLKKETSIYHQEVEKSCFGFDGTFFDYSGTVIYKEEMQNNESVFIVEAIPLDNKYEENHLKQKPNLICHSIYHYDSLMTEYSNISDEYINHLVANNIAFRLRIENGDYELLKSKKGYKLPQFIIKLLKLN